MNPRCTCPSGDGSLCWPCPAHPPLPEPRVAGYGMAKWPARLAESRNASDNTATAFWQSRHGLKRPPQLTDLRDLARKLAQ